MKYKYLNDKNLDFLKRFLSTYSPSGYEMEAARAWQEYVSQFTKVETDVLCNSVGIINPEAEFRIMLSGHLDEIGFQVMYISKEGLLYFRKLGGIDALTVPGTEVMVLTRNGKVPGVIGKTPIHLQTATERTKALELDELWIDIGAENKEDAESKVEIGDPVAVKSNCLFMGENKVMSKALDDKIGAFIVAEVVRVLSVEDIKVGVYGVASSQEEVGCRGAVTSSYHINPQVGFCLDVGFATDVPNVSEKKYGEMKLGGGAVIRHSADNNIVLVRLLQDVAKEKEIAFQNVTNGSATGGTDTCKIQLAQSGVATALLSIPNRYMHTPVEVCDLRDVDEIIALLVETIRKIDKDRLTDFIPCHYR
ncbi:MAG: M42 family metallopeptidase [Paludibacteraceae bacterium]|nr:M42 family metallopeptidase [Prevotellaceae bacterium]